MSFRFCERLCSPAGEARVPPFSTRAAAEPFQPGLSDYGRPRLRNVEVPVAPLLRALLRRALLLDRPPLTTVLEQLRGPLRGDRLDGIPCSQACVRLAVGHVRPEATLLQDDGLLPPGVLAALLERRGGGAAAPLLRLGELGERLLERDREHLLLGLER